MPDDSSKPKKIDLPESFGRIQTQEKQEDDKNVLQKMKLYDSSPLDIIYRAMQENKRMKVWTRNFKEVRGICSGKVIAFDKHWNIIMQSVDEVYLKPKRSKTPYLTEEDIAMIDFSVKKSKDKEDGQDKGESQEKSQPMQVQPPSGKKKKPRNKKRVPKTQKRRIEQFFIRGDNIVMVCVIDDEDYTMLAEAEN